MKKSSRRCAQKVPTVKDGGSILTPWKLGTTEIRKLCHRKAGFKGSIKTNFVKLKLRIIELRIQCIKTEIKKY